MFTVTERALMGRINRKLAKEGRVVRKTREGTRYHQNIGEFYIVDTTFNSIIDCKLSIEAVKNLAQELGCMGEWETVAE